MALTISASPCTMLKTPSGRPASFRSIAMRPMLKGTFSDGFMIMQFPRAMAFGIVQFGTMVGKLKGTIDATTPNGTCSVRHSTPLLTSSVSPVTSCGSEQANSVNSMHFSISATDSLMVLPFSSLPKAASSSLCSSSKYLYLKNTCTLSLMGVLLQVVKAALAASTACSRSVAVEQGSSVKNVPSTGDVIVNTRCDSIASKLPLI